MVMVVVIGMCVFPFFLDYKLRIKMMQKMMVIIKVLRFYFKVRIKKDPKREK